MNTEGLWFRCGVNVVVGLVTGGAASGLALQWLFSPRTRRGLWQGVLPKHRAVLAQRIAAIGAQRQLGPDDITRALIATGMPVHFEGAVARLVHDLLDTNCGTLRELLPPTLHAKADAALDHFASLAATRARQWTESSAGDAEPLSGLRIAVVRGTRAFLASDEVVAAHLSPAVWETLTPLLEAWRPHLASDVLSQTPAAVFGEPGTPRGDAFGEAMGELAVRALSSAEMRDALFTPAEDALRDATRGLLDRALGHPARWLPSDTSTRIATVLAPPLWSWFVTHAPRLAAHLPTTDTLERQLLEASPDPMQAALHDIITAERGRFVLLGGALGALIGLLTFGLSELTRWL